MSEQNINEMNQTGETAGQKPQKDMTQWLRLANAVDGKNPDNVRRVSLMPFADEDNTLTYFRAPNLEEDVTDEDELFGGGAACR